MNSISYEKFSKPGIMYVSEVAPVPCFSHVYRELNDLVYEHWLYSYSTNSDLIRKIGKKVQSITVMGSPTTFFPKIYDFTSEIGTKNISWSYSRRPSGGNYLILSFLKSKYTTRFFGVFLIDTFYATEDVKLIAHALRKAAEKYGLPLQAKTLKVNVNFNESNSSSSKANDNVDKRYFDTLGLQPTSNIGLIKAAYRELAKQFHPDSTHKVSTEDAMKRINEAYDHLIKKYSPK